FQAGSFFRYTAGQRPAVMKIKPYRATPINSQKVQILWLTQYNTVSLMSLMSLLSLMSLKKTKIEF
ncbi:MAG: hypothetical protein LBK06_07850, partial [Planctomycetaceae bacterium]|nr:hypothetical protein [Planctomycetaceae bacterium]